MENEKKTLKDQVSNSACEAREQNSWRVWEGGGGGGEGEWGALSNLKTRHPKHVKCLIFSLIYFEICK